MRSFIYVNYLNLILIGLNITFIAVALGEESHDRVSVKYSKQVILDISASNINRINFSPYQISRVISDKPELCFEVNETRDNLFVTPNLKPGTIAAMPVVLTNGKIIDLALRVRGKKTPSIITLVFDKGKLDKNLSDLKEEVSQIMQAMRSGTEDKYYIQNLRGKKLGSIASANKDLKIKQTSLYRYKNLRGGVFEIVNKSRKKSNLIHPVDIASTFKNILSISFDKEILGAGKSSKGYLVWRESGEGR